MKRVYVAGAYSADNVLSVLENMRKGMRASTEILLNGMAPFCPWLDYQYALMLREGESINLETYYRYSLAWLMASDVMFVLPGWENSRGTKEEIRKASEISIPTFFSMQELLDWKESCED